MRNNKWDSRCELNQHKERHYDYGVTVTMGKEECALYGTREFGLTKLFSVSGREEDTSPRSVFPECGCKVLLRQKYF